MGVNYLLLVHVGMQVLQGLLNPGSNAQCTKWYIPLSLRHLPPTGTGHTWSMYASLWRVFNFYYVVSSSPEGRGLRRLSTLALTGIL